MLENFTLWEECTQFHLQRLIRSCYTPDQSEIPLTSSRHCQQFSTRAPDEKRLRNLRNFFFLMALCIGRNFSFPLCLSPSAVSIFKVPGVRLEAEARDIFSPGRRMKSPLAPLAKCWWKTEPFENDTNGGKCDTVFQHDSLFVVYFKGGGMLKSGHDSFALMPSISDNSVKDINLQNIVNINYCWKFRFVCQSDQSVWKYRSKKFIESSWTHPIKCSVPQKEPTSV